jgi:Flp pilus assembly protein TadD
MATKRHDDKADAKHWEAVEEASELLHEERFPEAMVELRRVLQHDPKNPYAFYFLGIAFFESGEIEASRDAYAASVKLAPRYLGARVALCHVLRIGGDVRGAIREGMAALSLAPGDPDSLHAIGLAYHAYGDEKAARKYLEAFLDTGPELEVALETQALLGTLEGATPESPEGDDEDEDED